MDEPGQVIKSLIDGLEAINKVQAQQSKTASELAKLCAAENAPAIDVARVKDLQGQHFLSRAALTITRLIGAKWK